MPNLDPPVATTADALAYRKRILACVPEGMDFTPLMTLYLTPHTTPAEIARAKASGVVFGVKLYPKGATTNAERGVEALADLAPVLEAMEREDLPLLVHGEVTAPDCDVFDREKVFLDRVLIPTLDRFAGLRVVFEHITTAEAAQFVAGAPARVGATLTPQHLLLNRNALFEGGLRPHHYCLPVLKRERDREALLAAATSGDTALLPRHRQRASPAQGQGGGLRLRRDYSAPVASSSTPRRSPPPARSTGWRALQATTAPTSTACRETRAACGSKSEPGSAPRRAAMATPRSRSSGPGRPLRYRLTHAVRSR